MPLKVVNYLGSAHTGVVFWVMQRISAMIISLFSIWGLFTLFRGRFASYESFLTWMGNPWNKAGMLFLLFALTIHAVLGFQVIIEDYAHSFLLKAGCIFITRCLSIGLFLVSFICLMGV